MYSGITGDQMDTKIFIGPTYYMRLKHMSQDKINYRAGGTDRGPVDLRTHQPIGGRAKEGGLRVGEMERDAILGHGTSLFLQESFNKRSDQGTSLLCNTTGYTAVDVPDKYGYPGMKSLIADGPFEYTGTDAENLVNITPGTNSKNYSEITMPYGLGVTLREIEAMGIDMRLITEAGGTKVRPGIEITDEQLDKLRNVSEVTPLPEQVEMEMEEPQSEPNEPKETGKERVEPREGGIVKTSLEDVGELVGKGREGQIQNEGENEKQGIHLLNSLLNAHRDRQAVTNAEQIGHGFTQAVKHGHFGGLLKTLVQSNETQKANQEILDVTSQFGNGQGQFMGGQNQQGQGQGQGQEQFMGGQGKRRQKRQSGLSMEGLNSDMFTEGNDRISNTIPKQSGGGNETIKVIVNKSG
jgi:hypothetical protein